MTEQTVPESTDGRWWRSLWRVPHGRWRAVRWGFSLILPLALLLWAFMWALGPNERGFMTIRVVSQVTGEGIPNASVRVAGVPYRADDIGEIQIDPVPEGTEIAVSATGYETMRRVVGDPRDREVTFSLTGVLILGTVSDALSGAPVEGAELTVVDASGTPTAATRTDEMGGFVFKLIPEDSWLIVTHEVYGEVYQPIEGQRSFQVTLAPPPVSARVVDESGRGVEGASIVGPGSEMVSGPDGRFTLDSIGQGSEVTISADGKGEATVVVDGANLDDIVLFSGPPTPEAGS